MSFLRSPKRAVHSEATGPARRPPLRPARDLQDPQQPLRAPGRLCGSRAGGDWRGCRASGWPRTHRLGRTDGVKCMYRHTYVYLYIHTYIYRTYHGLFFQETLLFPAKTQVKVFDEVNSPYSELWIYEKLFKERHRRAIPNNLLFMSHLRTSSLESVYQQRNVCSSLQDPPFWLTKGSFCVKDQLCSWEFP